MAGRPAAAGCGWPPEVEVDPNPRQQGKFLMATCCRRRGEITWWSWQRRRRRRRPQGFPGGAAVAAAARVSWGRRRRQGFPGGAGVSGSGKGFLAAAARVSWRRRRQRQGFPGGGGKRFDGGTKSEFISLFLVPESITNVNTHLTVRQSLLSSDDGKPWKCSCGTVNFPTKHHFFDLPAFRCSNCQRKLALDFKFCLGNIKVGGKSLIGEICDQENKPICVAFAYAKAAEVTERIVSVRNGTDPDVVIPIDPSKLENIFHKKSAALPLDSLTKNPGIHKVLHMGLILRSEGIPRIDVRSTSKPEKQINNGEPYKAGDVCTIPADSFEEICQTMAEGTPLVATYLAGKRRSRLPYCKIYKSPSVDAIKAKGSKEIGHAVVLVGAGMKRGKKYFYFLNSWGKKFCPRKNKKGKTITGGIGKLRIEDLTKNVVKLCPQDQTGGERRLQDQSEYEISRINYVLMKAYTNQCSAKRLQKLREEANSKYIPSDQIDDGIFRDDEGLGSQVSPSKLENSQKFGLNTLFSSEG